MWHMYTMEYYSAIKRNEIELFVVRWMDLETVIQSEVSQKEKNKYCMRTHIYGIHINFRVSLSIFTKNLVQILMGIALYLQINVWRITLFTESSNL